MNSSKKMFFPLAMSLLLAACGNATPASSAPAASSEPGKSSAPEASSAAPSSSAAESSAAETSVAPSSSAAESSAASQGEGPIVTEPVEIYLMSSFNDTYQQAINSIVEDFKVLEPNITVHNIKETGSYDDVRAKVIQQVATMEHPDMFVGYPDSVQEVLNYGVGADMTDYINSPIYGWTDEDLDDIFPAYLEEGRQYTLPGSYSLPMCKSTEALFYNTNIIGANLAAIDPTINEGNPISEDYINDLTWEEMFDHLFPALLRYNATLADDAKLFTGPGVSGTGDYKLLGYDSDANLFITLAEEYGYGYTSVDPITGEASLDFINDGMKGLMKTFRAAYDKGYLLTGGTYAEGKGYTNKALTEGNMLFTIGSTAGASHQYSKDFETGVARLPRPKEGGRRRVISQGPSLAFLSHPKESNDANRQLASWLFYRYFTESANASYWARTTSYLPIRFSVAEDREYVKYSNPEGKTGDAVVKALTARYGSNDVGHDLYSSPVFTGSAEARVQVGSLLSNCLLDTDLNAHIDELFQTAYDNTLKKMDA